MINQNMKVTPKDISTANDVSCEKCGCKIFKNLFLIKNISPLMSPTGKEINVPIPTFGCVECNHVNKSFIPDLS